LTNLSLCKLDNNKLSGPIPTEISKMGKLQFLHLWVNKLTGVIPIEISNLTVLEEAWLGTNGLTGIIPTEISKLENLIVLDFCKCVLALMI